MRQSRLLRALSFGCAVLLSSSSWAATSATVEPAQGVVLVNTGNGFKQVKKSVKAKVGDSVMVSPDGAAKVAYADGCTVDVRPGAVMTIAALSPCAAGARADDNGQNYTWNYVGALPALAVIGTALYLAATSP